MLLILLSIVANEGKINEKDFAKRLQDWMREGFPELGDHGINYTLLSVSIFTCFLLSLSISYYYLRWMWNWYDSWSSTTSSKLPERSSLSST